MLSIMCEYCSDLTHVLLGGPGLEISRLLQPMIWISRRCNAVCLAIALILSGSVVEQEAGCTSRSYFGLAAEDICRCLWTQ